MAQPPGFAPGRKRLETGAAVASAFLSRKPTRASSTATIAPRGHPSRLFGGSARTNHTAPEAVGSSAWPRRIALPFKEQNQEGLLELDPIRPMTGGQGPVPKRTFQK